MPAAKTIYPFPNVAVHQSRLLSGGNVREIAVDGEGCTALVPEQSVDLLQTAFRRLGAADGKLRC